MSLECQLTVMFVLLKAPPGVRTLEVLARGSHTALLAWTRPEVALFSAYLVSAYSYDPAHRAFLWERLEPPQDTAAHRVTMVRFCERPSSLGYGWNRISTKTRIFHSHVMQQWNVCAFITKSLDNDWEGKAWQLCSVNDDNSWMWLDPKLPNRCHGPPGWCTGSAITFGPGLIPDPIINGA